MKDLSLISPIFHSKADFQRAFVAYLEKVMPGSQVCREFKAFPEKGMHLDIWIPNVGVAIELRYRSEALNMEWEGDSFALKRHSARDHGRYDFLKDIQRLERVVADFEPGRAGFAVLLTNDPLYWKPPRRTDTGDAAFRLHEGRKIMGEMAWALSPARERREEGERRYI